MNTSFGVRILSSRALQAVPLTHGFTLDKSFYPLETQFPNFFKMGIKVSIPALSNRNIVRVTSGTLKFFSSHLHKVKSR